MFVFLFITAVVRTPGTGMVVQQYVPSYLSLSGNTKQEHNCPPLTCVSLHDVVLSVGGHPACPGGSRRAGRGEDGVGQDASVPRTTRREALPQPNHFRVRQCCCCGCCCCCWVWLWFRFSSLLLIHGVGGVGGCPSVGVIGGGDVISDGGDGVAVVAGCCYYCCTVVALTLTHLYTILYTLSSP